MTDDPAMDRLPQERCVKGMKVGLVGKTEARRREVKNISKTSDLKGEKKLQEASIRWHIGTVIGNFCCWGRAKKRLAPERAIFRGRYSEGEGTQRP